MAWAFEFEDQIWFGGFRDLATNGVDKPVLNVLRMYGLMQGGSLVEVKSSKPFDVEEILAHSVREDADISAIASATDNSVSIMVWNYHDDDLPSGASPIAVKFNGIDADRVLVTQYKIDSRYSNSYEAWKAMGSPQGELMPEQYLALEQSGWLQMSMSPSWKDVKDGALNEVFTLERQGVALIKLTW